RYQHPGSVSGGREQAQGQNLIAADSCGPGRGGLAGGIRDRTHVGGHALRLIKVDDAEDKPAGLREIAVPLRPGVALTGRRLDGKYGQLSAGQILLTGPGGQAGSHDAEVVGARFGAPADPRVLSFQARLEAWETDTGTVGPAGARARAWQYAGHGNPLAWFARLTLCGDCSVLPAPHGTERARPSCSGDEGFQELDGPGECRDAHEDS